MSCTSCGTNFSFLKKEHGCKMCGFSFCGKCCNVKVIVPTISEKKKQQICKGCSVKLTNNTCNVPNKLPSPPLALQRRMCELGTQKNTQVATKDQPNPDKELSARLDKLKERPKVPIVSDQELRVRLSQLKGIPASPQTSSKITSGLFGRTNSATEPEQAEILLKQVQQQVKLDTSRPNADSELAVRLQKLRERRDAAQEAPHDQVNDTLQHEPVKSPCKSTSHETAVECSADNLDEESEAVRLVQQYMEQVALDAETGCEENEDENLNTSEKEDEFPWCVICTGDAAIRCLGCDMDLYCLRCHKECHDKEDLRDHKTIPFEK